MDVDGDDSVVGVLVEEDLGKFVEMFSTSWSADGELVCADGRGELGCDAFGDSCGDDASGDGATGYGPDVVIRFEEWYYAGGGQGIEGVLVNLVGGQECQDGGEGFDSRGVG